MKNTACIRTVRILIERKGNCTEPEKIKCIDCPLMYISDFQKGCFPLDENKDTVRKAKRYLKEYV